MSRDSNSANDATPPAFRPLAPTTGFRCDICGDLIDNTTAAWGQWYYQGSSDTPSGMPRCWDFSIVHGASQDRRCTKEISNGPIIGDVSLDYLLSADGFTYLLEFFVEREVDEEELSRFMMRLFVPGYEQAFRSISPAIAEGVHEPRCNRNFLTQSEIARIIEAHADGDFDTYN